MFDVLINFTTGVDTSVEGMHDRYGALFRHGTCSVALCCPKFMINHCHFRNVILYNASG